MKLIEDKIFIQASKLLWTFWDIERMGYYQTTYFFNDGSLMNILNINFGDPFENDDDIGESLYGIVITDGEQPVANNFDLLKDDQFLVALMLNHWPLEFIKDPDPNYSQPNYSTFLDVVKNGEKFLKWIEGDIILERIVGTD